MHPGGYLKKEVWAAQEAAERYGASDGLKVARGERSKMGTTADATVNGRIWDIVRPEASSMDGVWGAIAEKHSQGARGVIIDLSRIRHFKDKFRDRAGVRGNIRKHGGRGIEDYMI